MTRKWSQKLQFLVSQKVSTQKFKITVVKQCVSITWKQIDQIYPTPLFNKELIHREYIQQGKLGDCYFITALMRIAKQPHLVEPLFEKELPDTILGTITDSINLQCGAVVVYFKAFRCRMID